MSDYADTILRLADRIERWARFADVDPAGLDDVAILRKAATLLAEWQQAQEERDALRGRLHQETWQYRELQREMGELADRPRRADVSERLIPPSASIPWGTLPQVGGATVAAGSIGASPGARPAEILPLVVADLEARITRGTGEYGSPLAVESENDALWYAYEESLDLALYLRQELERRAVKLGESKP